MKDLFSVGEAAKAAGTTAETLRHYDRIGLVHPSKKDEWSGYRYYTRQDIVRLNTVRALQLMDLPLKQIKKVLEYDDLERIIEFLSEAEKTADEKIAALKQSKAKIQAARQSYKSKQHHLPKTAKFKIIDLPERVILLSDTLSEPTLDNLWNYLSHFYDMLPEPDREQFEFEDSAGIYTSGEYSRLFAVCTRFTENAGLKTLPAGKYLCADCTEEAKAETLKDLLRTAEKVHGVAPEFNVQQIIVSGILQWKYQIQLYLGA